MKPVIVLLLVGGAVGCRGGRSSSVEVVRVVAAASLRDAVTELQEEFERRHPGVAVQAAFTSSGAAVEQIANGAPFDAFFSADARHADEVVRRGLAVADGRRVIALGRLALWIPARVGIVPHDLSVLAGPAVRRVAMANPETAPHGRAAREALTAVGLWDRVRGKLVYGQDVAQAAQQAQVAADAGLVALSQAMSPALRAGGSYWLVPASLHAPLEQVLVLLNDGASGRAFVEFAASDEAHRILAGHGYERSGGGEGPADGAER